MHTHHLEIRQTAAATLSSRFPMCLAFAVFSWAVGVGCLAEPEIPVSNQPDTTETVIRMKIRIKTETAELTATLEDSATAKHFAALLPLELTLQDYNGTEKVSDLPKKLSTEGAPVGFDPSVGDIAYYAPWGNLAVFYRDFGYSSGLVRLGRIETGIEELGTKGVVKVRVELASDL